MKNLGKEFGELPEGPGQGHVNVGGFDIFYRVWGQGEPLLLIHGITT